MKISYINIDIKAKSSVKYLGVTLDQAMTWEAML